MKAINDGLNNVVSQATQLDSELACSLSCNEKVEQFEAWVQKVFRHEYKIEEFEDNVRLTFLPGKPSKDTLYNLISSESKCCNFLEFSLEVQDDGSNTLVVYFSKEHKEQLMAWLNQTKFHNSSNVTHTNDNLTFVKPVKKLGVYIMGFSVVGLLCCVSPFIAVGLASLGVGLAIPKLTESIDQILIALLAGSVSIVVLAIILPRLFKKRSC